MMPTVLYVKNKIYPINISWGDSSRYITIDDAKSLAKQLNELLMSLDASQPNVEADTELCIVCMGEGRVIIRDGKRWPASYRK